jgi:hypothetical protein
MDSGNQSNFVAANIENGQPADLIRAWEYFSQLHKRPEILRFGVLVPMLQSGLGVGVLLCEFVKTFAGDDVLCIAIGLYT